MSFFSLEFSFLLLGFFIVYWSITQTQIRNLALLGFNYLILTLFSPYFAFTLFFYTCFVYCLSHLIDTSKTRFAFLSCVSLVILILCFFKYYGSIKDEFDTFLVFMGFDFLKLDVIFPLGLSFYTFASITYLRAVYEARQVLIANSSYEDNHELESFTALASYLSFFPTIVAGPILRSRFFFDQYHAQRAFDSIDLIITLILFGIVKKALIANYLGLYSSPILNTPFEYHPLELINAIFAYSVQIYCDFSGYVNLVCAFALMLGFELPPNFNMPYTARNLKDFWNRWHISLSTFIRDFIYIPLGGNKHGFLATQAFVLIAFSLSGLWHGNTWTFLIWGLLHGFGLIYLNILKALELEFPRPIGMASTFIYVSFCWIFFYYHSLDSVRDYFLAFLQNFSLPYPTNAWLLLTSFVLIYILYPLSKGLTEKIQNALSLIPWFIKPFVLSFVLFILINFMPSGIPHFIYESF